MKFLKIVNYFLLFIVYTYSENIKSTNLHPNLTKIWGPGLKPNLVVMPARYFFIHAVNLDGIPYNISLPKKYNIKIFGKSQHGTCHVNVNQIDRGDGSVIVRYRNVFSCYNFEIHVKYEDKHIGNSPYVIDGEVLADNCDCPIPIDEMLTNFQCKLDKQITYDLNPFQKVNFSYTREKIIKKFDSPGAISLCNYVIKDNEIYRKCYGKHTGFKIFMDSILKSLTRKVNLPNLELFINLGDWPLVKKNSQSRTTGPYPVFSWCGSDDTFDIVLPTYDLTQSTLENMGQVMLDTLSVQRTNTPWDKKIEKGFWRGRDSNKARLELFDIANKHKEFFNVSFTNFFFFKNQEEKYGPKQPHISFFDFFKYKYQITLDGTVAAYRVPYLLAGNSLVFKQDSIFYEHFYKKLIPNKHFIPIKRDLSNLIEKLKWAKGNDNYAYEIMINARNFVENNLLPEHIFCYHVNLLNEWSKRIISPITIFPDMDKVEKSNIDCKCPTKKHLKDEL